MKGYVLRWNPNISSWTHERHNVFFQEPYEFAVKAMNWSIYDYEELTEGDFFILQQVGTKNDGIAMIGTFASEPYTEKSWRKGDGSNLFYADMAVSVVINRENDGAPLSAEKYEKRFPNLGWHGGHSGVLIEDALEDLVLEIISDVLENKNNSDAINFCDIEVLQNIFCDYIISFCPKTSAKIIEKAHCQLDDNQNFSFVFDNEKLEKADKITKEIVIESLLCNVN